MAICKEIGIEGAIAGANLLSRPAAEYENDQQVEALWAMKAFEHSEVYFNLISSVDPKLLKLTPHDDVIYNKFREEFPNLDVKNLNEDDLKSADSKEKWRPFCLHFEHIVQDFNYATLIRLDSSDEYSEKNSIIVTRIQFYAVELARNREGCNDDIRHKFKPKKKDKTRKRTCSDPLSTFLKSLNTCLQKSNSEELCVEINRTEKPIGKCDFRIFTGRCIPDVIQNVRSQCPSSTLLIDVVSFVDPFITVNLNRSSTFTSAISCVQDLKSKYGRTFSKSRPESILVNELLSTEADLTLDDLRGCLTSAITINLLKFHGYETCLRSNKSARLHNHVNSLFSEKEIPDVNVELYNKTFDIFMHRVKTSKYRITDCDDWILDGRSYLEKMMENESFKNTYDANIFRLPVTESGRPTNLFKNCVMLECYVKGLDMCDLCINITSHKQSFKTQQTSLIWKMITSEKSKCQHFIFSPTISQAQETVSSYLKRQKEDIVTSVRHKHGQNVDLQLFQTTIASLTNASVKFDFLAAKASSPVKLSQERLDSAGNNGRFVMYNCARLSMLLSNYSQAVIEDLYPQLPPVSEVDFSKLKHQMEWKLLFQYVLYFPTLIKESLAIKFEDGLILTSVQFHKITGFLISMCRDLSCYYSKIHILGKSEEHLLPTLYARLYLIKSVRQVLVNGLSLLNIEEIHRM